MNGRPWTAEEDATLTEMAPAFAVAAIALALHRTADSVQYRIRMLGIIKSPAISRRKRRAVAAKRPRVSSPRPGVTIHRCV